MIKKILNNKVFQFFYKIIKAILFTCIILYVLFVLVQRLSNNSAIFGYRIFTVETGSMVPTYKVNDIILVKTVATSSLKVRDVVAYQGLRDDYKGKIISHRIIKINNDGTTLTYTTKGDANAYEDPYPVAPSQIYGQVLGKVYGINLLNHVIKNQYGFFFLIFVPLVLVIFLEIADTIIDMQMDKKKLKEAKETKETKEKASDDDEII